MNKKILISTAVSVFLAAISSTNSFAVNKDCKQANYNPDYTVKNGHSLDSSDLFTRHMVCSGETIKINKHNEQNKSVKITVAKTPIVVIVKPTEPKPTEEPKEKECKNKNSGKDGTPEECNAGKGQEKHDK